MDDLDKLIEAVEAGGDVDRSLPWSLALDVKTGMIARDAYRGSLDAALRLHEALLPGWHVAEISEAAFRLDHDGKHWLVAVAERAGKGMSEATGPYMSRAWLLAILRALKAKAAQ